MELANVHYIPGVYVCVYVCMWCVHASFRKAKGFAGMVGGGVVIIVLMWVLSF
jgi:hypothetical protein